MDPKLFPEEDEEFYRPERSAGYNDVAGDADLLPDPPAVIYIDDDDDDDEDWYDHLSADQQREVDEREAFNDRLDAFRREF